MRYSKPSKQIIEIPLGRAEEPFLAAKNVDVPDANSVILNRITDETVAYRIRIYWLRDGPKWYSEFSNGISQFTPCSQITVTHSEFEVPIVSLRNINQPKLCVRVISSQQIDEQSNRSNSSVWTSWQWRRTNFLNTTHSDSSSSDDLT